MPGKSGYQEKNEEGLLVIEKTMQLMKRWFKMVSTGRGNKHVKKQNIKR